METITATELQTGFVPLFAKSELESAILDTLVVLTARSGFVCVTSPEAMAASWALMSSQVLEDPMALADPDMDAGELDLRYSSVQHLPIAQVLMQAYDYGMSGMLDVTGLHMDDSDGDFNWISRIVYDLRHSTFLTDWVAYKDAPAADKVNQAVERCLITLELANARLMLEGGSEGFFLGVQDPGVLTIRQMALLSGMSEASVRTLANPKRPNHLVTTKDGANTVVEIGEAKKWLKTKGRYLPVRKINMNGAGSLTDRKFADIEELEAAIQNRIEFLAAQRGAEDIRQVLRDTGVQWTNMPFISTSPNWTVPRLGDEQFLDRALMQRLATALEVSPDTFPLRAAETVLHQRLRLIEHELKGRQAAVQTESAE